MSGAFAIKSIFLPYSQKWLASICLLLFRLAQIPLKQPVEEHLRELLVIRDLFIELEIGVDHLLEFIVHDVVEGQAGILWRVDSHTSLQSQDRKSTRLNSSHSQISYAAL